MISDRAAKEDAEIHWCDETGKNNQANVCKGYRPRGSSPVMKASGQRFSIRMISSITNLGPTPLYD